MSKNCKIGYLSEERLSMIPEEYHQHHEFCFFLHDNVLSMLREYELGDAHNQVLNMFEEAVKGREDVFKGQSFVEILKGFDNQKGYEHFLVSHVIMGLTSDLLNFLYEALTCFEKRKFSVGFALLRKPLKENLLYLCFTLADRKDFLERYEKNNYNSLNISRISGEKRKEIFEAAIRTLKVENLFNAEILLDTIYSKKKKSSLEITFQRSTHLVTSHGDLLKTKDMSFNNIFNSALDNDYYDFLYVRLPYILMFLSNVTLEAFNQIHEVEEKTYSNLVIAMMGAYQGIYASENERLETVDTLLEPLLAFTKCGHCKTKYDVTADKVARLFIRERFLCPTCGIDNQFPLDWILRQGDVVLDKTE